VKLIGYALIWFTFLVLASMVYVKGQPLGSIWYEAAAGLAILIVFLSARAMARSSIITIRYEATLVVLTLLLAIIAPFLVI
jgi:hypothetical protein